MKTLIEDNCFKEALKEAIVELIKENKGEFREILQEALEDFLIGESIKEGLLTENVSREEVI